MLSNLYPTGIKFPMGFMLSAIFENITKAKNTIEAYLFFPSVFSLLNSLSNNIRT